DRGRCAERRVRLAGFGSRPRSCSPIYTRAGPCAARRSPACWRSCASRRAGRRLAGRRALSSKRAIWGSPSRARSRWCPATRAAARARATAFGLDICAARLPPLLELSRAAPTGRELQLDAGAPSDLRRALERDPQRRELCVRAGPDGRDCFRIDEHARSYVLWGQDRGSYMIAARGDRRRLSPSGDAHTWQRFLVGQVLPFAALLRGLELFHSSAVSLDGGV